MYKQIVPGSITVVLLYVHSAFAVVCLVIVDIHIVSVEGM